MILCKTFVRKNVFSGTLFATIAAVLGVPVFAFADFNNRFELKRDGIGQVVEVAVKDEQTLSLRKYSEEFRELLANASAGDGFAAMMPLVETEIAQSAVDERSRKRFSDLAWKALSAIKNTNFDAIFNDPKFQSTIEQVEKKIRENPFPRQVMANLHDTTFFYRQEWYKTTLEASLNIISITLGNVPGAALAVFLVQKHLQHHLVRRAYYQSYVLHYLDTVPARDLAMTEDEVHRTRSSIFESRINWFQVRESKRARENWTTYGEEKFKDETGDAKERIRKYRSEFDSIGEPVSYGFFPAVKDGRQIMLNGLTKESIFYGAPSVAYQGEAPKQIRDLRITFEVLLLGIHFVPVPGIAKEGFSAFMKSLYIPQVTNEGALFASYEKSGNTEAAKNVAAQSVNPFLVRELSAQ